MELAAYSDRAMLSEAATPLPRRLEAMPYGQRLPPLARRLPKLRTGAVTRRSAEEMLRIAMSQWRIILLLTGRRHPSPKRPPCRTRVWQNLTLLLRKPYNPDI